MRLRLAASALARDRNGENDAYAEQNVDVQEQQHLRNADSLSTNLERQQRRHEELLADGRRQTAAMRHERLSRMSTNPSYVRTTYSRSDPTQADYDNYDYHSDNVIDSDVDDNDDDNDHALELEAHSRNVIDNSSSLRSKVLSGIRSGLVSTFRRNRLEWKPVYEGEKRREQGLLFLISRYNESVDGGFLAPYRYNRICKIDYSIPMVRSLIIGRKLAPFYVPMEDYDTDWPRNKIIEKVNELDLHERYSDLPPEHPLIKEIENTSYLPVDDLKRDTISKEISKELPFKEQRALRFKIFNARLIRNRVKLQERETNILTDSTVKNSAKKSILEKYMANDNLKYEVYKDTEECPICFMNIPKPLNKTKCCKQSLCTECFVSIRRVGERVTRINRTLTNTTSQRENDRSGRDGLIVPDLDTPGVFYRVTLDISNQATRCPYCTCEDFAVVYEHPKSRRTGIGGIAPALFVPNQVPKLTECRTSIISELDKVKFVRSDDIRPQWRQGLRNSRSNQVRNYNERIILANILSNYQGGTRSDIPINSTLQNFDTQDNSITNENETNPDEIHTNETENRSRSNVESNRDASEENKRSSVNTETQEISEEAP
ncbi:Protein SIP5 [Nakaseomyces bracarensis]|uniref:Protein SIP5 n=1 Tax=Nakaseomyces bracarensis TaxID=273131 RepID=A0ABR4NVD4_9SACH